MTTPLYAQDGVNVSEGDDFSAFAAAVCRSTFANSPFVKAHDFSRGHFRGPRGWRFVNLPDTYYMDAAADGIGTKVMLIDAVRRHFTAPRDVLAMTAGDITRWGGKPLIFMNVLDVASLGATGSPLNDALRAMMTGLVDAAKEQDIVCWRGETAELGACVGSENPHALAKFNWAGVMLGVYLPDRIINGETLAPAQVVVALEERGLRSNGFSSVRKALALAYGDERWLHPEAEGRIRAAAMPSALYDKFLADANGWTCPVSKPRFRFRLVTHVTGGGIVGKFGEDMLFPRGLSAELTHLFPPPQIARWVAETRGMEDAECYRTFGCGNGVLVVLDAEEADGFIAMARDYGVNAKQCGIIQDSKGRVPTLTIHSEFSGEILKYSPTQR